MAIEENNLLGGASLASQLEKMQSTPDVVAPTPIVSAPSTIVESQPFSVDQEQEISAGPSTLDLLDDSNDNELST